jgi:ribokinase
MPNSESARRVVVIGSINMDLVCRTPMMPAPGQTVLGSDFVTVPGGKGANQAVAAARLGANVHMIGRVGSDDFGERLLNGLRQHNVNTDHVTITEGISSGVAMILVDGGGENSIVVSPGANHQLTPADVDSARELIATAAAVVLQLEIPLETVRHAIGLCQEMGVFTILDPAPVPAKGLKRALFGVDVLTPNRSEAESLLGLDHAPRVRRKRPADAKQTASDLLARGAQNVVLKLGSKGAVVVGRELGFRTIKPYRVKVVDTTAAGDAFVGALATGRADGLDLLEAVKRANAAGALACEGFGAQPSLPTREALEKLLRSRIS